MEKPTYRRWDKDDDTLASYIARKLESELATQTHKFTSNLLKPICKFTREEIRYQLQQQSITVRLSGLQEMKERDFEMQKQILLLTETVAKLSEQVAVLATSPTTTTTATPATRTVVAPPQTHRVPVATAKPPPPTSTPTYTQMAEKKPREFTEVKSKKEVRKKTILPKPYPTADRLVIFNLTEAPNDRSEAADCALQVVNKTITNHADITDPPLTSRTS